MDVSQTPGQPESTMDESSEPMSPELKAESLSSLGQGALIRCGSVGSPMEDPIVRQLVELSGLPEEFIEAELVPSLPHSRGSASATTLDDLRTAMLDLLDRMNEDMIAAGECDPAED